MRRVRYMTILAVRQAGGNEYLVEMKNENGTSLPVGASNSHPDLIAHLNTLGESGWGVVQRWDRDGASFYLLLMREMSS